MSDAAIAVGCTLPTSGPAADPSALASLAQAAEDLGYASVWLSDHVVVPERITSSYPYSPSGSFPTRTEEPYLEPLVALSFLGGATRRVRLGTHVLILPYRHPLLVAKMISTLDNLSGGRVDLGVGAGWMREEFEALGHTYYERRGAVTDEMLRILQLVWTRDVTGFEGEFFRFAPLGAHPRPVQQPHPPIWVGGHSRPAIRRAARFGDGWLPIGGRPPADLPPDELAQDIAYLRAEAERAGRDPTSIRVCFSTNVVFDPPPDAGRPFHGSPDAIAAELRRYRAIGVQGFIVGFGALAPVEYERRLRRFAEQVLPGVIAEETRA